MNIYFSLTVCLHVQDDPAAPAFLGQCFTISALEGKGLCITLVFLSYTHRLQRFLCTAPPMQRRSADTVFPSHAVMLSELQLHPRESPQQANANADEAPSGLAGAFRRGRSHALAPALRCRLPLSRTPAARATPAHIQLGSLSRCLSPQVGGGDSTRRRGSFHCQAHAYLHLLFRGGGWAASAGRAAAAQPGTRKAVAAHHRLLRLGFGRRRAGEELHGVRRAAEPGHRAEPNQPDLAGPPQPLCFLPGPQADARRPAFVEAGHAACAAATARRAPASLRRSHPSVSSRA